MQINLEVLRALQAIGKYGSLTAAAEYIHKTPSALTYMIKKLERDLDIIIFDRSSYRARFTPAGLLFLEQSNLLLNHAIKLETFAKKISSNWKKTFNIVIDSQLSLDILEQMIFDLKLYHSDINLNINVKNVGGYWRGGGDDETDIYIGSLKHPPECIGYSSVPLGVNERVFVASPYLIVENDKVLNDLVPASLVVLMGGDDEAFFEKNSAFKDTHKIYVNSINAKMKLLLSGSACGFISRHEARYYLKTGQLIEKVVNPTQGNVYIYAVWRNEINKLMHMQWVNKLSNQFSTLYDDEVADDNMEI